MFPNEATYLYDWTRTSKLSYGDFLRAKQFERSIRYAIDNQTKELVATNRQLTDRGIEILTEDIDRGFTMISEDISAVGDAVRDAADYIMSTLNWGFSEVLISLGHMNDSLTELIKLARTPSQTWAFEQFEIARDEFRRALYPESLESVRRASEGHGSNIGYKTEFRFHFLLGTILLGNYKNSSPEIVDTRRAEDAFLAAARYAEADFPTEAGNALICAGRAAYSQSDIQRAIDHTRRGLKLAPLHSDGMYQLARTLFLDGQTDESCKWLVDAIMLNVDHAVCATGDIDFLANRNFLNLVLTSARNKCEARFKRVFANYGKSVEAIEGFSFRETNARVLLADRLSELNEVREAAEADVAPRTIVGFHSATTKLSKPIRYFPSYFETFKSRFIQRCESEMSSRTVPEDSRGSIIVASSLIVGIFVGIATFIVSYFAKSAEWFRNKPTLTHEQLMQLKAEDYYYHHVTGAAFMNGVWIGVALFGVGFVVGLNQDARQRQVSALRARRSRDIKEAQQLTCPANWIPSQS
jgi:tetratricopeptide (TPR) repeat protein